MPYEDKSPAIQAMMKKVSARVGGGPTSFESKASCATCQDPDLNFRDELSKREYGISRMCQKCQDGVEALAEE